MDTITTTSKKIFECEHDYVTPSITNKPEKVEYVSISTQTDLCSSDMEELLRGNKDIRRTLLVNDIVSDDQSCKFYTGIPSIAILTVIFNLLLPFTKGMNYWRGSKNSKKKSHNRKRKLNTFEEFLLVLVRLRQGWSTVYLGKCFGISNALVSSIFNTWLALMFLIFKELMVWPSRIKVDFEMPVIFKKLYPKTRVILDCTEVFIQKPSLPSTQKQHIQRTNRTTL